LRLLLLALLLVLAAPLCGGPARAARPDPAVGGGDSDLCAAAIRREEAATGIPRGLLGAVALTESGRRDPDGGGFAPWPWTVNNGGEGRYLATKGEALAWIERLRREGRRNIDVGCMQVNLMYHPDAFADAARALDPRANVAYGAGFLAALHAEVGSWPRAVERYHTAEPERGGAYRERVYANWDRSAPSGLAPGVRPATGLLAANLARAAPPVWAGGASAVPARTAERPSAARAPGRTLGPGRFFPIVFGPRPTRAAAADTSASPVAEPRQAPPKRGRDPAVLGLTRPIPGAVSPSRVAAVPPVRPGGTPAVTPVVAPAPGGIAFLSGGWLAPTAGPPGRPAGARPVRRIAASRAARPPPD
jgi:hypothetical protein